MMVLDDTWMLAVGPCCTKRPRSLPQGRGRPRQRGNGDFYTNVEGEKLAGSDAFSPSLFHPEAAAGCRVSEVTTSKHEPKPMFHSMARDMRAYSCTP